MRNWIEKIRTRKEKRRHYKRMARELSELDPRELEAVLHIRPRDIEQFCHRTIYDEARAPKA